MDEPAAGDEKDQPEPSVPTAFPFFLTIGISVGVAIGISIDNLALGIGLGIALGAGADGVIYAQAARKNKS